MELFVNDFVNDVIALGLHEDGNSRFTNDLAGAPSKAEAETRWHSGFIGSVTP